MIIEMPEAVGSLEQLLRFSGTCPLSSVKIAVAHTACGMVELEKLHILHVWTAQSVFH